MRSVRALFRYLKPYWKWAFLAPLYMVLEVAMDLLQPRLVQAILDDGIASGRVERVAAYAGAMIVVAAVGVLGGALCTVYAVKAAQAFGADLRSDLFSHIQSLSFSQVDRLDTGSLITRLTNDVTQVQEVVLTTLRIMVRAPLLLVGSFLMAVFTSPKLALIFAVLLPVLLVALVFIIRRIYPLYGEVQKRLDSLNTTLQENLAGIRVVKAFVRAEHEEARFNASNDSLMKWNQRASRFGAMTMPFMMVILNLGIVSAIWMGAYSHQDGDLTVGQLVAFINYLVQTLMALMFVSMMVTQVARAGASAERIDEVFGEPSDPEGGLSEYSQLRLKGGISFEGVSFSYNGADEPVLQDLTISVQPGQTLAILGATGSGKTSLAGLIPRFYEPTKGRILMDGHPLTELGKSQVRSQIGMAFQEPLLFSGSIKENVKFGRNDLDEEEIERALSHAEALDFVKELPEGQETDVSQRGVNLSGGQKQRLALARALAHKPPILILDDSVSALDVMTEQKVQTALKNELASQTKIIVAQRISSVRNADLILVLEGGRIESQGTHEELLSISPIYQEISRSQESLGGSPQS